VSNPELNCKDRDEGNLMCRVFCVDGRRLCDEVSFPELARELIKGVSKVEYEASHDELTGLPNRRKFIPDGERAIDNAEKGGDPVGIIIWDIDHFKQYNDQFGHTKGDKLLAELGEIMNTSLRHDDLTTARWGGDEFITLCKLSVKKLSTKLEPAQRLVAVTTRISDEINLALMSKAEYLSCSFGASLWKPGMNLAELIDVADKGMYRNKRRRKDDF